MRTKIITSDNPTVGDIVEKNAESKYDKKRLALIVDNINFLNQNFPEFGQEVIYSKENEIGLRAFPGSCLFVDDAFNKYPKHEWVIDSIATNLNLLQKKSARQPGLLLRLKLIRPFLLGFQVGCKYSPVYIQHAASLLFGKHQWVYSHGDFTENNFVLDHETHSVWIIDWENLRVRPKYYDDFHVMFHYCTPLFEMGWQTIFAKNKFQSVPLDELLRKENHTTAVLMLFYLYYIEMYRSQRPDFIARSGKFPGKDSDYFEKRALIRYQNLKYLSDYSNWSKWLSSLLD